MDIQTFQKTLKENFGHKPTKKQNSALEKLAVFLLENSDNSVFILKGYAGTGKTTIINTLVKGLKDIKKKAILIAPTGRAAKVITGYTGIAAKTIHQKIYFTENKNGQMSFTLRDNKEKNAIFIIDEASMISDNPTESKLFESGSLLRDIFIYAFAEPTNKLIFIGDTAQLPPVKQTVSPALSKDALRTFCSDTIEEIELNEVVRQASKSGILHNATLIRDGILNNDNNLSFELGNFEDIKKLQDSYEIEDAIVSSYDKFGKEQTCIIVYSNKRANIYNKQIRYRILGFENEIEIEDQLMVVKNNYFWLSKDSKAGFIANGDTIKILEIHTLQELYGFKFAEVTVKMLDYPNEQPFKTVLLLDTLESENPSLSYNDSDKLYKEIMKDYSEESSKYKKFLAIKNNKYYNALQVKFSYAITCHKSQGGQWQSVIIEQGYLPNGITTEYMRWLYTAFTRATKSLCLIGFRDTFFE